MTEQKHIISLEGIKKLEKDLEILNKERISAVEAVSAGREHGDLKENAEYQSAREWQNNVEAKIASLSLFIKNADIVDITNIPKDGTIVFGSKVELQLLDTGKIINVQILGEKEADFEKQQISIKSPLGKALLGKKVGDIAVVEAPSSVKEYDILKVL